MAALLVITAVLTSVIAVKASSIDYSVGVGGSIYVPIESTDVSDMTFEAETDSEIKEEKNDEGTPKIYYQKVENPDFSNGTYLICNSDGTYAITASLSDDSAADNLKSLKTIETETFSHGLYLTSKEDLTKYLFDISGDTDAYTISKDSEYFTLQQYGGKAQAGLRLADLDSMNSNWDYHEFKINETEPGQYEITREKTSSAGTFVFYLDFIDETVYGSTTEGTCTFYAPCIKINVGDKAGLYEINVESKTYTVEVKEAEKTYTVKSGDELCLPVNESAVFVKDTVDSEFENYGSEAAAISGLDADGEAYYAQVELDEINADTKYMIIGQEKYDSEVNAFTLNKKYHHNGIYGLYTQNVDEYRDGKFYISTGGDALMEPIWNISENDGKYIISAETAGNISYVDMNNGNNELHLVSGKDNATAFDIFDEDNAYVIYTGDNSTNYCLNAFSTADSIYAVSSFECTLGNNQRNETFSICERAVVIDGVLPGTVIINIDGKAIEIKVEAETKTVNAGESFFVPVDDASADISLTDIDAGDFSFEKDDNDSIKMYYKRVMDNNLKSGKYILGSTGGNYVLATKKANKFNIFLMTVDSSVSSDGYYLTSDTDLKEYICDIECMKNMCTIKNEGKYLILEEDGTEELVLSDFLAEASADQYKEFKLTSDPDSIGQYSFSFDRSNSRGDYTFYLSLIESVPGLNRYGTITDSVIGINSKYTCTLYIPGVKLVAGENGGTYNVLADGKAYTITIRGGQTPAAGSTYTIHTGESIIIPVNSYAKFEEETLDDQNIKNAVAEVKGLDDNNEGIYIPVNKNSIEEDKKYMIVAQATHNDENYAFQLNQGYSLSGTYGLQVKKIDDFKRGEYYISSGENAITEGIWSFEKDNDSYKVSTKISGITFYIDLGDENGSLKLTSNPEKATAFDIDSAGNEKYILKNTSGNNYLDAYRVKDGDIYTVTGYDSSNMDSNCSFYICEKVVFVTGVAPGTYKMNIDGKLVSVIVRETAAVSTVEPPNTTVNLFDFWSHVDPHGKPSDGQSPDEMINGNHALKFLKSAAEYYIDVDYGKYNNNQKGATLGIVGKTLGDDGYPFLNSSVMQSNESLAYLFDPSMNNSKTSAGDYSTGKVSYENVNGLFRLDDDGYYSYNSMENYAEYDSKTNSFKIYDDWAVYSAAHSDYNGQFFPFVPMFDENGMKLINHDTEESSENVANHFFGLSLSTRFTQVYDGHTSSDKTQATTFEFSGDDDVWIYIDGVLVGDVGGIHGEMSIKIDFSTGEIILNDGMKEKSTNVLNDGDIVSDYTTSLYDRFKSAGLEDSEEWQTVEENGNEYETFANGTNHTLDFFYLERGAAASNLNLKFNITEVQDNVLYKTDQYGNAVDGAVFAAYKADKDYSFVTADNSTITQENIGAGLIDGEYIYDENYNICDRNGILINAVYTDVTNNGKFVFKDTAGSILTASDMQTLFGEYFILREVKAPDDYRTISPNSNMHIYEDKTSGEFVLKCDNTYESGTNTSSNVLIAAKTKLYMDETTYSRYEDNCGIDNKSGTYGLIDYYSSGEKDTNGILFAVMLRKTGENSKEESSWEPFYGSDLKGYTMLGTAENEGKFRENVLKAVREQYLIDKDVVFTVSDGRTKAAFESLPGNISNYHNISGEDADFAIAYYWSDASSLEDLTKDNIYRVDGDSNISPFEYIYGNNIEVADMMNELSIFKKDENGNAIENAAIALYEIKAKGNDIYYIADDNTVVKLVETKEKENENGTKYLKGTAYVSDKAGMYIIDETTGVITVSADGKDLKISPAMVGMTNEDGTICFSGLTNGTYCLREVSVGKKYKINLTEVLVAVDDAGIYANAGNKDDGIAVSKGIGKISYTLLEKATADDIDRTLTYITVAGELLDAPGANAKDGVSFSYSSDGYVTDEGIVYEFVSETGWPYLSALQSETDTAGGVYDYENVNGNISKLFSNDTKVIMTDSFETVNFNVKKSWNDNDNINNTRPDDITVELLQDDNEYERIELSAENNWEYVFSDLQKFDANGNEYSYSVKEINIPENYSSEISEPVLSDISNSYIVNISNTIKKYNVSYIFESGTDGMDIPEKVNGLIPVDENLYPSGSTVNAAELNRETYVDSENNGTWTFQKWDANSKTVENSDIQFVGIWNFRANPEEILPEETTEKEDNQTESPTEDLENSTEEEKSSDSDSKENDSTELPTDEKTTVNGDKETSTNPSEESTTIHDEPTIPDKESTTYRESTTSNKENSNINDDVKTTAEEAAEATAENENMQQIEEEDQISSKSKTLDEDESADEKTAESSSKKSPNTGHHIIATVIAMAIAFASTFILFRKKKR